MFRLPLAYATSVEILDDDYIRISQDDARGESYSIDLTRHQAMEIAAELRRICIAEQSAQAKEGEA